MHVFRPEAVSEVYGGPLSALVIGVPFAYPHSVLERGVSIEHHAQPAKETIILDQQLLNTISMLVNQKSNRKLNVFTMYYFYEVSLTQYTS